MPPKKEKKNEFRFNASKVFLTYPKCDASKEAVLAFLETLGTVNKYCISREKHQDGSFHIHAVCEFLLKQDTRNPRYFDFAGYHPNIQRVKTKADFIRSAKYTSKDGDFIEVGGLLRKDRSELLSALVQEGQITAQFIRDNPAIMGLSFSSLKGFLGLLQKSNVELRRDLSLQKKRHLWVHGPSNTGKSTWLYAKLASKNSSVLPENHDYTGFNVETEVIYADEYRGCLTVQQLNKLCDGCCHLNTKGGSTSISQPLIIIVSNYSIRNCYVNISDLIYETVLNRFNEYDSSIKLPDL